MRTRIFATLWLTAFLTTGCSDHDEAGAPLTTGTTTDVSTQSETQTGDADATPIPSPGDAQPIGEDSTSSDTNGTADSSEDTDHGAPDTEQDAAATELDATETWDDAATVDDTGPEADSGTVDTADAAGDTGPTDAIGDTDGADPGSTQDVSAGEVDAGPPKPLYLLSVNNGEKTLEKIDVETGEGVDVCQLPATSNYPSLTFSRNNILYASRQGSTLDTIDPCTCEVTTVGPYNGFTGVNGITSNFGANLFGVSHIQDVLIDIDTQTGAGTSVGPLGVNFGYTGATWDDSAQTIYAIDAASDALFTVEPATGQATQVAPLSLAMGTVGIEMHPANGILYACSDPADLLAIDLVTGEVTIIGPMGQNTACNNLAAPWQPVPCLDEL